MKLEDFDYALPEELIAQEPLAERDASRLLVLRRSDGRIEHRAFREVTEYLREGDLLVLNDAKVIPARLLGRKVDTGGKVELVLTMPLGDPQGASWRCIGQASKAIRPGMRLDFEGLGAEVLAALGDGSYDVRFDAQDFGRELERVGRIPLPPYIKREPGAADRDRYQTVFAARPGAAAAPTAGFHFTDALLAKVRTMGVEIARVTLYVGAGTFLPIRVQEIEQHHMHAERYEVGAEAAQAFARTRARGGRVIPVGTTALRTLESSFAGACAGPAVGSGVSELFIYPGYTFRAADALLTNFHLPGSTLLLLVCALAGRERMLGAYREAVERRYRFFSYGDAMLIL
ncbi:MAG: tRNA preQ1(34) S-adenosylmethionine ribosyltransferase-isomerase QueA [Deltaproteobacteria bacterium]|nr:tRNA preQ1(34) S-adenosylmethionine ribosyltransferase-isomerase QueA [Deltaproteobacteria bacterium]